MNYLESNIIELLHGVNSIPVKLRMKENVDVDYDTLLKLLDQLIEKYKGKNEIPKKLAYTFLDISNNFDLSNSFYTVKELEVIEDMGNAIEEKIIEFYES